MMKKELAEELIRKVLPSYEMKEILGEGSFGAVFRISDSLKERAVKIISLNAAPSVEKGSLTSATKKVERDFRHIVDHYERIACEEIVTVYDFFKLAAGDEKKQAAAYAVVVMELYPTNLYEYVIENFEKNGQLFDIETAKSLMVKLAQLLGNLYIKREFLFEDLKPDNILVKELNGNIKMVVGDIGGLKNLGSISATSSQVTLSYCAPEVIRKGQKPDLRSIMYSYGLISYFILEGHLPYENDGVAERIDRIKSSGIIFDRKEIPDYLQEVIQRCLSFEPEARFRDFQEITDAVQDAQAQARGSFDEPTIDLEQYRKGMPQESRPAQQRVEQFKKPVVPFNIAGSLKGSITLRSMNNTRRRAESVRPSEEKENIEAVQNEIRDLVIRSGDMYKLQNESYKVYNDIKVESGAMFIIENTKLYFDENAGIMSSGTLRARNSTFSALNPAKKWKNIVLHPSDTRINFIDGCKFRLGKGREWGSLKKFVHIQGSPLTDNYLYGGALFIAGVREKIMSVSNCHFLNCSAHEGGAILCLKAQPSIEACVFENCSAGLIGGAISSMESNPSIRTCMLNRCFAHKEGGGMSFDASNPSIENCTFEGCSTRYLYGGGIFCSGSNPTIKGCKFNRCVAGKDGGGIFFDEKSSPRILYPAFAGCKPNDTNQSMKDGKNPFFYK
jgi:serine/threonine protein kinase